MPRPRFCRNLRCPNATRTSPGWLIRDGTYPTLAHGKVQRYRCRACGHSISDQSESMHYHAKLRLDLQAIFSRLRGGSSLRDIGRELSCSRTAVANAVLRLGRQAMASHAHLVSGLDVQASFAFDGLLSAVTSRDYPSQITTLAECSHEMLLAMSHAVGERGGTRTPRQLSRIELKRQVWRPGGGALRESISQLVEELPRFAGTSAITLVTDEHPLYRWVIDHDVAMSWYRHNGRLHHTRIASTAPRSVANPLFALNYLDRMIRHRLKEHTRESIAIGRSATMQMHRMWIFAWDHNVRQPYRVGDSRSVSRAVTAGASSDVVRRLQREFSTRRQSLRGLRLPQTMRQGWLGQLDSPPVRWKVGQKRRGPQIRKYAKLDLRFAHPHGQ